MELDPSLAVAVAPGAVAVILSIATFVLTQRRAQQIDDRAAAKDTVDMLAMQNGMLASQNKTLQSEIGDLRKRVSNIERARHDCERERAELLEKLVLLREQMMKAAADDSKPEA